MSCLSLVNHELFASCQSWVVCLLSIMSCLSLVNYELFVSCQSWVVCLLSIMSCLFVSCQSWVDCLLSCQSLVSIIPVTSGFIPVTSGFIPYTSGFSVSFQCLLCTIQKVVDCRWLAESDALLLKQIGCLSWWLSDCKYC